MSALRAPFPPSPFGWHDYHIRYLPPGAPREVDIRAHAAAPLRVGDLYTIDHHDHVYELVVERVSHTPEGRWRARCRVLDLTAS
jgi:hypothetical protein